jgi:hypothetical protein
MKFSGRNFNSCKIPFGIKRCHTAGTCSSDSLPVNMILYITAGKNSLNVCSA